MRQAGYGCRILSEADIDAKRYDEQQHVLEGVHWGVTLPGGGCAEHEHGIKRLLLQLSIDPEGAGVGGRSMEDTRSLASAAYKVTRTYHLVGKRPKKRTDMVLFAGSGNQAGQDLTEKSRAIYNADRYKISADVSGAWGEDSFKIAGWTDEGRAIVQAIIVAASDSDLTVWTGGAGVFSHAGLHIAITSRMPQKIKDIIERSDREAAELEVAVVKTGIRKKLDEARNLKNMFGKPYFALAPRWKHDNDPDTRHPVMFYLNPADQQNCNHGWYTVEQLKEWIKDKGPIPKKG